MKKIEKNLLHLIEKDLTICFPIIITVDTSISLDTNFLEIKGALFLMENILTTSALTGKEIKQLSQNNTIIAIELDSEMGV